MSPFINFLKFPALPCLYISCNLEGPLKQKTWASTQQPRLYLLVSCCWWQPALRLTNLPKSIIPETEEAQIFPSTFSVKNMDTQALWSLQTHIEFLRRYEILSIMLIQLTQLCKFLLFSCSNLLHGLVLCHLEASNSLITEVVNLLCQ